MNIYTEQQARRHLIDLVRSVKSKLNLPLSPRYLGIQDPVAAHFELEVREAALELDEGEYIAERKLVVIDPRASDPDRLNFTFFHEITHHIIREDGPLYSFLHEYAPKDQDFKAALEVFCNIGAAEFLVPSQNVRDLVVQQGFSMTLIETFETIFSASKPAIALQMAHCASHKCFVVVCEYGSPQERFLQNQQGLLGNQEQLVQPKLFVRYSATSPAMEKYSIGRFVTIPKDHVIYIAYQNKSLCTGTALIPFRSGKRWEVDCEAFFYRGKVYAAFNVTSPLNVAPGQQSMFGDI